MLEEDERRQYVARQYESLREEMAQARQSQQNILQWSQAVSGTLFAAALVAGAGHSSRYIIAAQFVLGLVIPAVLLGAALTWSGELIRLTRIGVFLRSFEMASWDETKSDLVEATSLFVWQNFAWSAPRQFTAAGFRGKQNVGYMGIGMFFGVMYLGSIAAFCIVSSWPLTLIVPVLLVAFGILVMLPPALQLFKLNATPISLTATSLTEWLDELKARNSTVSSHFPLSSVGSFLRFVKKSRNSKSKATL